MMSVLKTEVLPLNYSPSQTYKFFKKNWPNKVTFFVLKNRLEKTIRFMYCLFKVET